MAYRLVLPPSLFSIYLMFYVSMLWHYILDESHVISMDSIKLGLDLTYEEEPMAILDR